MRKILIAAIIVVVAFVAILSLRHTTSREPKYNGQPLSALVLQAVRDRAADDTLIASRLKCLDTNAVPFLIDWIRYEPPSWRFRLAHLVLRISRGHAAVALAKAVISTRQHDLAVGSLRAFQELGTNAAPAIPALVSLMNDQSAPGAAYNALVALGDMGPNCLPPLIQVLRAPRHLLRFEAMNIARSTLNEPGITVTPSVSNAIIQAAPELLTNSPAQ